MDAYEKLRSFTIEFPPPLVDRERVEHLKSLFAASEEEIESDEDRTAHDNDWSILAYHWVTYFPEEGVQEGIRCAERIEALAEWGVHYFTAAATWRLLAAFQPALHDEVRRCLLQAETVCGGGMELALCALQWHSEYGLQERNRVMELLSKAESQCGGPGDVSEIVGAYGRILPKPESTQRIRAFLLELEARVCRSDESLMCDIADAWLNALGEGAEYKRRMDAIAKRKLSQIEFRNLRAFGLGHSGLALEK